MSTPTKSKFFLLIIAILLITNITLLFFLLNKDSSVVKKPAFDRTAATKEFLQKEIGFTAPQMQQFDTLAKKQKEKMKAVFEDMRTAKEKLFKAVGQQSFADSAINQAVTQSLERQKLMEMQFYSYVLDIRKLCTASQQPAFDSLFYKMWSRRAKKLEEKK